jgi:hypothetical protein
MTPKWKLAGSGAAVLLVSARVLRQHQTSSPRPSCKIAEALSKARCDAPPPAPQGPVKGGYFWKSERDGPYYYFPPICTNDQIPQDLRAFS